MSGESAEGKLERLRNVPHAQLDDEYLIKALQSEIERLRDFVQVLIDNYPGDDAADGVTVLDVWRKQARDAFGFEPGTSPKAIDLDIPAERYRTEEQRADIQRAWNLIGNGGGGMALNSTDGHLIILRAIQLGRMLARRQYCAPPPPREPTPEMITAAEDVVVGFSGDHGECTEYCDDITAKDIWQAMFDAGVKAKA